LEGYLAGEIIRMGDRTSHNGTVIEGSQTDICMGKPIAYVGHKVHCPKCRGDFPIVEGVMTTTFYGKGVAVAGMKTSCGATLIAGQFTDIVEWGGGNQSDSASVTHGLGQRPNDTPSANHTESAAPGRFSGASAASDLAPNAIGTVHDEQFSLADDDGKILVNIPYTVRLPGGLLKHGTTDSEGLTMRYVTNGEQSIEIYLGHIQI